MSLTTMYAAKAGSPKTTLAAALAAADTSMTLTDASVLPSAPNLAVIGSDSDAEVVSYTAITGNVVSGLVRGLGGTVASAWSAGEEVARNITSLDHDTFRANILDLDTRVPAAGDANRVLKKTESGNAWSPVDLTTDVTGTLPIANGGTGVTSWANFGKAFSTSINHSQVFYVNSTGSDSNDGLTAATAFATIGKALQCVYAGATINIAGGTSESPKSYAGFTCTGKMVTFALSGYVTFTSKVKILSSMAGFEGTNAVLNMNVLDSAFEIIKSFFMVKPASGTFTINCNATSETANSVTLQSSVLLSRATNYNFSNYTYGFSVQASGLISSGNITGVANAKYACSIAGGFAMSIMAPTGFVNTSPSCHFYGNGGMYKGGANEVNWS